jgi:opacity protein-like surface antigen
MKFKLTLLTLLIGLATSVSAEEEWQISWTPYLWAANLSADIDFGRGPISADLDFEDILDKLEGTFMHYLEFRKGRWGIANEIIYLNIADSQKGPIAGIVEADADLKQTQIDLVATYHTGKDQNTMLYGGLRYLNVEVEVDTTSGFPPLNLSLDGDKDWTNLLVGVRQTFPLNDKWSIGVKGDIATDFDDEQSYMITLGANYDMTDLLDLKFGYRYIEIEFEDSDIDISETVDGAFVGLTFNW